jgi:hypothetical protein|tara:strand:- start:286 stop:795 length:510 start_codon:yes stop_codon:yes gene_type:complete
MHLEIDVSGSDIFDEHYSICISAGNGKIKGFKINNEIVKNLNDNWKQGKYDKYRYQPRNQGAFKARIYNIVIKLLLKEIFSELDDDSVSVCFCRDFPGHEESTRASLHHCITHIHKKIVSKINCNKLQRDSDAHKYAKMMNGDTHNYLGIYLDITLEQIEPFLIWTKKK